ncbi:hypothetical protein STEG23_020096 [Scotinomys teguina]
MPKCQSKNTVNSSQGSVVLPEPSSPTRARSEYSNADEAPENNLENNAVEMREALKEEIFKKSFKEIEEKTNKNLEEIDKSLKESQEKTNTDEGKCSRPENGNRSNKENTKREDSGDRKIYVNEQEPPMQASPIEYKRWKRESQAQKTK